MSESQQVFEATKLMVPFDPDAEWGVKAVHHVSGCRVRVTLEPGESGWAFTMNPTIMQHAGIAVSPQVPDELSPEGRSAVISPRASQSRSRVPRGRRVLRHARAVLPQRLSAVYRRHEAAARPARRGWSR